MKTKSILDILKKFKLPTKKEINTGMQSFKRKDWVIVCSLILVMITSSVVLLSKINNLIATVIPVEGGSISEGIVGTPRFVNPILAISGPDKDLTKLVYSGLMRSDESGGFTTDLAENYEISEDGLSYIFKLKDNVTFHDGTQVTAEDIIFTIGRIQDPLLKSPERVNWEGVSVERIDRKTVKFKLRQPYISFLDNSTIGILPSHIWSNIPTEQFSFSDYNLKAIGSGPYKISTIQKKGSGVIESYELKSFKDFILGKPYIKNLDLHFFSNEASLLRSLSNGSVDAAHALTPRYVSENKLDEDLVKAVPLSRSFSLFFNQNKNSIFQDQNLIEALELSIDKQTIISLVLNGFGSSIDHPIPKTIAEFQTLEGVSTIKPFKERQLEAENKLDSLGWNKNEDGVREKNGKILSFSISTGNAFELQQTAEIIREYFDLMGIQVELKVFEIGNLNQNVIRTRNYEALFFGQIISKEADLYAFWHSSQIADPGLNIAMYANKNIDKILESLLKETPTPERFKLYANLKKEFEKDKPAIFIYSPDFIYVTPKNVKNISYKTITEASDRFNSIHTWYIQTDTVWNVFLPKDTTIID
ncbi:MAG: peptide/nickel transport system substrate-binding protein [Candidatus Paceibacteria bacterium]|jgi:peptide/nickel transport system substrate-binding protein